MNKLVASPLAMPITLTFHAEATQPREEWTASGMAITALTEGKGANPKASDTVKVHYRGTLDTAREFDRSYKRGQPATVPLTRVIPFWTEGVQKIKAGGKAKSSARPISPTATRGFPVFRRDRR